MNTHLSRHPGLRRVLGIAAAVALAFATSAPHAQDGKGFANEATAPFPVFQQWVTTYGVAAPDALPPGDLELTKLAVVGTAQAAPFEPMPVILGLPELPLLGGNAGEAARNWGPQLNYQGVHARLVVVDASGRRRELRSMAAPLRAGERFKIRVTATFDAVADIDQVQGPAFGARRAGQVYPAPGQSVGMRAGEAIELPLAPHQYFVMGQTPSERVLLSVRHVRAVAGTASTQPAYRQDAGSGSSYLQLVPRGQFPVIEQLVSSAP